MRRRELALETVRSYVRPSVLDVGCGSGRVAEQVLDAGAAAYVGIDLAGEMLGLARTRLARFCDRVTLIHGDFIDTPLGSSFDVVLGLGIFDYLADPEPFVERMGELSSGSVVASFPAWHWFKGPLRKLRYEVLNDCPIFDYTDQQVRSLFEAIGFARIDVRSPGRTGFLVRADR